MLRGLPDDVILTSRGSQVKVVATRSELWLGRVGAPAGARDLFYGST